MSDNSHCDHYSENGRSSCKTCGKRRFYLGMLTLFSLVSVMLILRFNWPETFFCSHLLYLKNSEGVYLNNNRERYDQCYGETAYASFKMVILMTLLACFDVHRIMAIEKNRKPCSHEHCYEEGFKVDGCNYCSLRFSYRLFKIMYETLGKQSSGFKLNKKMK